MWSPTLVPKQTDLLQENKEERRKKGQFFTNCKNWKYFWPSIKFKPNPCEWPAYYFSLEYHPCIKHFYYQNRGNDRQLRKFLVVEQFLLSSTWERTVLRICILMFGCKRLQVMSNSSKKCPWHLTIWTVCPYPCYKIKLPNQH